MVLGLADLSSKNSARDFIDRANEKSKSKLSRAMTKHADLDDDLKEKHDENKEKWDKKVKEHDKFMKK